MDREWLYGDPIPPDMRSLNLQELQQVAIDWRMLTPLRPKLRQDEEMFSRLVNNHRLLNRTRHSNELKNEDIFYCIFLFGGTKLWILLKRLTCFIGVKTSFKKVTKYLDNSILLSCAAHRSYHFHNMVHPKSKMRSTYNIICVSVAKTLRRIYLKRFLLFKFNS